MSQWTLYSLVAALIISLTGCEKKKEEDAETDGAVSQSLSETSTNIGTVHDTMLPGSLVLSTGTELDGNPCANTDGFFDCQPELLKIYMHLAKQGLKLAKEITGAIQPGLKHIAPPYKGTIESDGTDEGFAKIDLDVESATKYSLVIHSTKGPFLDLTVDGTTYNIKGDQGANPDEDSAGKINIDINYTDKDNFTTAISFIGMPCKDDDIRAPQNMFIKVAKTAGKSAGKAMLYMPRWLGTDDDLNCAMTPTETSKLFLYTDFAGNSTNATASLYMMPVTVTSAAAFDTYAASKFCTNFSGLCMNGQGFGDPNPVSTYGNPFCANDGDTTWNGACSDIPVTDYTAATEWAMPETLSEMDITLRSSL